MVDTGLAADLTGTGEADFGLRADGRVAGALFENLVAVEVHKQATWSDVTVDIAHFRDRNGPEVDLVIEDRRSGRIAALAVKLTATPTAHHARHLALLRDRLGDRLTVGLVLHSGAHTLPLGERLWAVPLATLWRSD